MIIEAEHLTYTYAGAKSTAINNLNFSMEEGEVFGFLGPSGAGKSTTQKILFNHLRGYSGSVKLFGKELNVWDHSLYHQIGVGFELPNHYLKLSARENLKFFASFYKRHSDMDELLDRVGLLEHANKLVGEFSKGMKMRLNFIRALLHQPKLLFLDEPTSGLDPTNARIIKDLILEQKSKGVSIFLTTHQMGDADELCDRVAFLSEGVIKALDTPLALKLKFGQARVDIELESGGAFEFPLKGIGQNKAFLKLIQANEIKRMHSKEASLDDIFIQVTGKNLAE